MRLVVFLTYGNSLHSWEEAGILNRELAIYQKYCTEGHSVTLISYGNSSDHGRLAKHGGQIEVLINKWRLPIAIYGFFIPILFWSTFRSADVLKTNQLFGAHIARRVKTIFGKFLIIRLGYDYFGHELQKTSSNALSLWYAKLYETRNLRSANLVITSTNKIKRSLESRTPKLPDIVVVPNYIDLKTWSPPYQQKQLNHRNNNPLRICFFGRFVEQKNLFELLDACQAYPVELTLIGDGPLKEKLATFAAQLDLKLRFISRCEQSSLPQILRKHDLFVLPSRYEGHPKALIEAMAFGIPVLGANGPGMRELIQHGQTGVLTDPSKSGLREGIRYFLSMSDQEKASIGRNARQWAITKFSLDHIFKEEVEAIQHKLGNQ